MEQYSAVPIIAFITLRDLRVTREPLLGRNVS